MTAESDPSDALACAHSGWAGLPITLERLPAGEEVRNALIPDACVSLIRAGSGKRRFSIARRSGEIASAPGMLDLCARDLCFDRVRWEGSEGEVVAIRLPIGALSRLLQGDAKLPEVATRFEHFDPAVAHLMEALWNEAALASPNGPLYVQGLSIALVGLLRTRYSAGGEERSGRVGRFGARDIRRLLDFIDDRLCGDLRMERLAAVVGMSQWHFAKMFKATFGESPHAFMIEKRVQAASRALREETDRPLVDIANDFGFSSQAHFTDVFRRRVGTTPARWRRAA